MDLLIGQAWPPHPRFLIITGPGIWGYGEACSGTVILLSATVYCS